MITWDLFLTDEDGEKSTALPGVLEMPSWSNDGEEPGGGTFVYSLHDDFAETADLLGPKVKFCIIFDGDTHPTGGNFEIQEPVKTLLNPETGKREITYAFTSLLLRLGESPAFLAEGDELSEERTYTGTAIAILNQLINDAQARGELLEFTKTFGNLLDSNGIAHDPDTEMTIVVQPEWTILDVWRVIRDRHAADLSIRKHIIRAYNYGTHGQDFEPAVPGDAPAFILEGGRDLLRGERKADPRTVRNVAQVRGAEGRWANAEHAGSIAQYGRRVQVFPATDVSDQVVLQRIANLVALRDANPITYKAYEVALRFGDPLDAPHPYDTWFLGDRVPYRDDDSAPDIKYGKVANIKVTIDREGQIRCWIAIDTRRASAEARRDWQIGELMRGMPAAPVERHKMPPAAPTSYSATTGTEPPSATEPGPETAWLQPAWTNPTTDFDGEDYRDPGRVEVRWRIGTGKWRRVDADAADTSARITGLPLGRDVDVLIFAVDTSGNYSAALAGTTTTDTGTGQYRAVDSLGVELMTVDTDDFKHTKVVGGALAATGEGIDVDSTVGIRLFDPAGSPAIFLDNEGNASFTGSVLIGGTTTIEGTTEIHDDLLIDGNTEIGGTLDVVGTTSLGGTLTLAADLDAAGFTLEGARLTTGTGNIVIDDDTISLGSAVVSFSGSQLQLTGTTSLSVAGSISGSSTLTITGTSTLGDVNCDDLACDDFGANGASPQGIQSVGAAAVDALTTRILANNMRAAGIAFGLFTT